MADDQYSPKQSSLSMNYDNDYTKNIEAAPLLPATPEEQRKLYKY